MRLADALQAFPAARLNKVAWIVRDAEFQNARLQAASAPVCSRCWAPSCVGWPVAELRSRIRFVPVSHKRDTPFFKATDSRRLRQSSVRIEQAMMTMFWTNWLVSEPWVDQCLLFDANRSVPVLALKLAAGEPDAQNTNLLLLRITELLQAFPPSMRFLRS